MIDAETVSAAHNAFKKPVIIDVRLFDQDNDSTRTTFEFETPEKKCSGYGVEDEYREKKVHGETRIDNGLYDIEFNHSPKFSPAYYRDDDGNILHKDKRTTVELIHKYHTMHESMQVMDVKNFDKIRIHWGTTDDDTEGCYIVGTKPDQYKGQKAVFGSRAKYEEIYPLLWRAKFKLGLAVKINYDR